MQGQALAQHPCRGRGKKRNEDLPNCQCLPFHSPFPLHSTPLRVMNGSSLSILKIALGGWNGWSTTHVQSLPESVFQLLVFFFSTENLTECTPLRTHPPSRHPSDGRSVQQLGLVETHFRPVLKSSKVFFVQRTRTNTVDSHLEALGHALYGHIASCCE